MSSTNCPYCELRAIARAKSVYVAIRPIDGRCPDCGAHIDAGQHSVKINEYADIYKGALRLIDNIVEQFNELLAYCDIDLSEHMDTEDGMVKLRMNTSEIMEQLFVPYAGGTTKCNVANALEIEEDLHTWYSMDFDGIDLIGFNEKRI